ncbi:hybrid sensor histidine kinase/response regulator [Pantanalinema sp. GBBB05]|uniref:hybrid sensor histidine kinase/response regulator n=1 Tax=Pantanalinema sp. GBBB05 TaxID=2604139 RepID=UPI001D724856|nr:hybrid sensor histidine kinase/response regulator [Pantanalinema sp. GBBB05]
MTPESSASVILLVDDNPTNLNILVAALRDSGYKLRVAQDGESAIAQIPYAQPDLILLDVMMPGIDGFETCRRLKADPATQAIPVVFMTALTETFDKVQGFQMGAVDYITKPFEIDEVLIRIQTHLAIQNLQNQLQIQNQQLQQEIHDRQKAQEALQVFLHAVSHDLRNPVTGGLMVLQSLLGEAEKQAGSVIVPESVIHRMIQSHDRQLELINSLLETQANEVAGVCLHLRPVKLLDLVNQLTADWEALLSKNEAILHNLIPLDLPPVNADPNQLWRVYENLMMNALKHNPPGLTLTLAAEIIEVQQTPAEQNQLMMCCTVQDDGEGIPPEQSAMMFELYKRGQTARRTVGLGLGLYLCRQIITAHGGEIGVDSTPGTGSRFWFTLPLSH